MHIIQKRTTMVYFDLQNKINAFFSVNTCVRFSFFILSTLIFQDYPLKLCSFNNHIFIGVSYKSREAINSQNITFFNLTKPSIYECQRRTPLLYSIQDGFYFCLSRDDYFTLSSTIGWMYPLRHSIFQHIYPIALTSVLPQEG